MLEPIKPNFLIIGSEKSGTTSLHYYIAQHPQIFMSYYKELNYFNHEPKRVTLEKYLSNFAEGADYPIRGESTPTYLVRPYAAQQIKEVLGQPKMAIILRDPTPRAASHFWHQIALGKMQWEPNFSTYIHSEMAEQRTLMRGKFYARIQEFLVHHPRENFFICFQEDLIKDGVKLCQELFAFLDVDPTFVPNLSEKRNVTIVAKNQDVGKKAHKAVRLANKVAKSIFSVLEPIGLRKPIEGLYSKAKATVRDQIFEKPPEMTPEDDAFLREYYREDILKLQDFLGRDLSHWLQRK